MNKLQLKEYAPDHFVYLYLPEGRGDWGEIGYSFKDGTAQILKQASENSLWHDNHALAKVGEIAQKKSLPIEVTQAWY